MSAKIIETHRGWNIRAYRQRHFPPYLKFVAIARKSEGTRVVGFNIEGNSLAEAAAKARAEIDVREGCFERAV